MSELIYKSLIDDFLRDKITSAEYAYKFSQAWQDDRETEYDPRFRRLIDRIFSSCDCFDQEPSGHFEISGEELKKEVWLLSGVWWGLGVNGLGIEEEGA